MGEYYLKSVFVERDDEGVVKVEKNRFEKFRDVVNYYLRT
jgi:hypothetical protein